MVLLIILTSLSALALGQVRSSTPRFSRHELFGGIGVGKTFEDDVSRTGFLGDFSTHGVENLGYLYHFNHYAAVGLHQYYCGVMFYDIPAVDVNTGGRYQEHILVEIYNVGLRGQWVASRSNIQPYAYLSANAVGGSSISDRMPENDLTGWSVGAGVGVKWVVAKHFALSGEVLGSSGAARWDSPFFRNSTSKDYDPSLVGLLIGGSFLWGKR